MWLNQLTEMFLQCLVHSQNELMTGLELGLNSEGCCLSTQEYRRSALPEILKLNNITYASVNHCKKNLDKMTTSEGYCSFNKQAIKNTIIINQPPHKQSS